MSKLAFRRNGFCYAGRSISRGESMASEYEYRKSLTFEQAEGVEPLPQPLKLKEVSTELRARLWDVILRSITQSVDPNFPDQITNPWLVILYRKHITRDHQKADEFYGDRETISANIKLIIWEGDYLRIFGFLQFVLRQPNPPPGLAKAIDFCLKSCRAAYRVLDGNTIIPCATEEEGTAIKIAFADLKKIEFGGARTHLRNAGSQINAGNYADSIRESIHAVEAVARILEPKANTLGAALKRLEKATHIHKALKDGFGNLYGYASDEHGIRHPLLDDPKANVDETDAVYMFGACAAFVSYLFNKTRDKIN